MTTPILQTEICNIALTHLNIGKEIKNYTTDMTQEAQAMRRVYPLALRRTLRDFNWPWARRLVTLTIVTDFTQLILPANAAQPEWNFSYRYPADCEKARRIPSGIRNDNQQSRVPFKIYNDASGALVFTDMGSAQLEYTALLATPEQFMPSDFIESFSYLLAALAGPRLTGGDPFKVVPAVRQNYMLSIAAAKANAVSEEQPEEAPDSELIRVRDGRTPQTGPGHEIWNAGVPGFFIE
jgi:hypothetical protein